MLPLGLCPYHFLSFPHTLRLLPGPAPPQSLTLHMLHVLL